MPDSNRYMPNEMHLPRIEASDLEANAKIVQQMRQQVRSGPLKSAVWFLPHFTHALKGGLRTTLSLAQECSRKWGTQNTIVLDNFFGRAVPDSIPDQIRQHFPDMNFQFVVLDREGDVSSLPQADAGFCSLWVTAYTLARYNKCHTKFYIMQDYEPMFYPGGTISLMIEQTYRLGFFFLSNTEGVASKFRQYSDWGMAFTPGVDTELFHPSGEEAKTSGPYQIVFYGRPNNDRNSFLLGSEALRLVKRQMGDNVRILSVGMTFPILRYELHGVMEHLGLLSSMEEVANLYRSSDLALSLMATPHPSYQPLEYMASGCPAVTNINELNNWLYRDGENIILSEPLPNIMAERIIGALEDADLRRKVIAGGIETVSNLSWETAFDQIMNYIASPSGETTAVSTLQPTKAKTTPIAAKAKATPPADKTRTNGVLRDKDLTPEMLSEYDFLDMGTKDGNSMSYAIGNLGGKKGLGVELRPEYVQKTIDKGFAYIQGDATKLQLPDNSVSFVLLSHFLEHLPDLETLDQVIATSLRVAKDFVFIKGPGYENEDYLQSLGVRIFYSHWSGHPIKPSSKVLSELFKKYGQNDYEFMFHRYITSTDDPAIHSLQSPINQHAFDIDLHPPKPKGVVFDRRIPQEMMGFVRLREGVVLPSVPLIETLPFV